MPRPRVKAENRKRCVTACVQCRLSKKKCDSHHPCRKCIIKGEASSCYFPVETRPKPRDSTNTTQEVRTASLNHQSLPRNTSEALLPIKQRSILLKSSFDERIYFGNTAAISFLKFLQQTWRTYVEPNNFTEDQDTDQMLEAKIPHSSTQVMHELSDEENRSYVETYLHASSGILDLFTERDIERLLCPEAQSSQFPRSPDSIIDPDTNHDVNLDLMIAIGAQCETRNTINHYIAIYYFRRAQKAAFAGMLQTPTVNLARSFALMAFYMLGACSRNSALMYVGVASNISMILGLHLPENYKHLPIEKKEARLQTGKSIRVLDLICNTILGRPGSTPVIIDELEYLDGEVCPNYGTLCTTYEAVAVLQSVVNDTKEKDGIPIDQAEEYLQQLREWSSKLPLHLRRQSLSFPSSHQSLETRRATIGKIHLACIYYYGVIQITRQFLVEHIFPFVCGDTTKQSNNNSKSSDLAKVCTEAAVFMAQICDEAEGAQALLGNMCILKAWLFSGGLVLGFSLLRPHDQMEETRRALQATSRILERMGINSPQAKQYHRILASFAEAIDSYERKRRSSRAFRKNSSIEKILCFEEPQHQPTSSSSSENQRDETSLWESSQFNPEGHAIEDAQSYDPFQKLDWSALSGDNDILRMFLDPCLDSLLSLPSDDFDWGV